MSRWNDDDFKRYAFDYVRGDLAEDEAALIEEKMHASPAYREYVKRIDSLVGGARKAPPESEHPFDADALFGRIEAAVAPAAKPAVVLHLPTVEDQDMPTPRPVGRWVSLGVALAACLAAGLYFLLRSSPTPPPASDVANIVDPAEQPSAQVEHVAVAPVELDDEEVGLYASQGARFALSEGLDKRLKLEEGTVLVEFVPQSGGRLTVDADQFEVRVVGTIFYASTDGGGVVGVVAGEVVVTPENGAPTAVKAGQEYRMQGGLQAASADRVAEAELHVDVERHLDVLAARAVVKDAPIGPRKVNAPKRLSPENAQTRDDANRLIREGDVEGGAAMLEKLLGKLNASDPIAGSIRLDLARIYLKRLGRPQQAAIHLRRFVTTRPNDAATPLARDEYCRIVRNSGRTDEICR
ncbi:MAG: hypothetical protein R3E66_13435 [bacterium]